MTIHSHDIGQNLQPGIPLPGLEDVHEIDASIVTPADVSQVAHAIGLVVTNAGRDRSHDYDTVPASKAFAGLGVRIQPKRGNPEPEQLVSEAARTGNVVDMTDTFKPSRRERARAASLDENDIQYGLSGQDGNNAPQPQAYVDAKAALAPTAEKGFTEADVLAAEVKRQKRKLLA